MIEIYCDGGTIGPNPSSKGGTWAYVVVEDGTELCCSGHVVPSQFNLPWVSNNVSELYATLMGLEEVGAVGECSIHTDNYCTYCRLKKRRSWKGVPDWMITRVKKACSRVKKLRVVLVAGHPEPHDLARGYKGYLPCSRYNVMCDEMCNRESRSFAVRG